MTTTAERPTYPTAEDLRAIGDLRERISACATLTTAGKAAVEVRDEAIVEALKAGMSQAEVRQLTGLQSSQVVRYAKRARGEAERA